MKIILNNVGKRFQNQWILRSIQHEFLPSSITGLKGRNGSGKSTFLNMVSSLLTPSEGHVHYLDQQDKEIPINDAAIQISHVAPSINLVPKLSIEQTIAFHTTYRPFIDGQSQESLLETIWLTPYKSLSIEELSSGMRQRLKLGLAFTTQNQVILLDEPTSNLDEEGIALYHQFIQEDKKKRTLIIASNESRDFYNCSSILDINSWKSISHA